jgi:hypothetical protein
MADPTAVIVRFAGDPDDLLERLGPHVEAVGMTRSDHVERMPIEMLGSD